MAKREERESWFSVSGVIEGMPLFAKELLAGAVAGGIAKSAVAPLERVKILFQTRQAVYRNIGLLESFTKIARTEGITGFYRGNGASSARIVPYAALHFMAYEEYRRLIMLAYPDVWKGPVLDLVAGSFAGGTALLFTYPLDLVRTRLAYQVVESSSSNLKGYVHHEQLYKGIRDCFFHTYKEAGLKGLYRGVVPSLYGIFPYAGLKFYFYEEMKSHIPKERRNDILTKLTCGSIAGLLGQTFTYPLDVVRRQMQVEPMSSANTNSKGTLHALLSIVRKQGWKHLFSGLSLNYLRVVPSTAISFTVYDSMKLFLQVPPRAVAVIEVASNQSDNHSSSLHS